MWETERFIPELICNKCNRSSNRGKTPQDLIIFTYFALFERSSNQRRCNLSPVHNLFEQNIVFSDQFHHRTQKERKWSGSRQRILALYPHAIQTRFLRLQIYTSIVDWKALGMARSNWKGLEVKGEKMREPRSSYLIQ